MMAVLFGLMGVLFTCGFVLLLGHLDDTFYAYARRRRERKQLEKLNKAYDKRLARRGLTRGW